MNKIMHYCRCIVNIVFSFWKKNLKKFVWVVDKFLQIIICIYYVYITKHKVNKDINQNESGVLYNNVSYSNFQKTRRYDLTIIVPVYNVEQYIEECLLSIINQKTDYNYEVIIIDDGSTDKTTDIIKSNFKTERIKLLKQDNAGQSVARNKGISLSQGKYIMFVDGDDILLPNAIENMMNEAYEKDADIVEGDIVNFRDSITEDMIKKSITKYHLESNEINPNFVLSCYGYSVAKVYRAKLWETLRFPEGYIFEDVITKFILRRKANQVVFLGEVVYGYRRNPFSSSRGNNNIKLLDSIRVFPYIILLCQQEDIPFDDVFYMLALNHIGLLNYITVKIQNKCVQSECFLKMKKQLASIDQYKADKLPFMFKLLEKSISDGNMDAWQHVADTIIRFNMLKKWREIN